MTWPGRSPRLIVQASTRIIADCSHRVRGYPPRDSTSNERSRPGSGEELPTPRVHAHHSAGRGRVLTVLPRPLRPRIETGRIL
jgi:hypothetical protein